MAKAVAKSKKTVAKSKPSARAKAPPPASARKALKKASAKPVVHRWTRKQYLRMSELGWFAGTRVQLIDGRIFDMPAQKDSGSLAAWS